MANAKSNKIMKKNERFPRKKLKSHGVLKILRIMKLTTYLLFISVLQVVASGAYSQSTILTLDLGETTVEQVLTEIENQSEFYFLFSQKLVDVNRKVDVQVDEIKIDELLAQVFNGTNVDYIVLNRQIVLSPSKYLSDAKAILQQNTITGTVTDENGMLLPGVNVVIKGTTIGTITDVEGQYKITVPGADAVLVISYVGYSTQEIVVGNQTIISVALARDLTSLDEVVVIGYGEATRKVVTGAIVSLKEDEMTKGAATSSISSMIQGRAAGVEVSSNDGLPGQALNIVIRGATSISNSNEPLYVIDGFPVPAGVSISPEDIESIDILKDAASAAIYGSRASAGVILITTKKGRAGQSEISLDSYYGVQSMIGEVERLDWTEVASLVNQQYADGVNDGDPWYNAADIALPNNTNWLQEATRQAPVQNYSLPAEMINRIFHYPVIILINRVFSLQVTLNVFHFV